jgi:hypothetical protein
MIDSTPTILATEDHTLMNVQMTRGMVWRLLHVCQQQFDAIFGSWEPSTLTIPDRLVRRQALKGLYQDRAVLRRLLGIDADEQVELFDGQQTLRVDALGFCIGPKPAAYRHCVKWDLFAWRAHHDLDYREPYPARVPIAELGHWVRQRGELHYVAPASRGPSYIQAQRAAVRASDRAAAERYGLLPEAFATHDDAAATWPGSAPLPRVSP